MKVLEFPVGDGDSSVYIQLADEEAGENGGSGLARAAAGERVVRAAVDTWEHALAGMRVAAEGALAQLNAIEPVPDEVEVTFKVAVSGKLGATVVTTSADAHMDVKVVWKKKSENSGTAG